MNDPYSAETRELKLEDLDDAVLGLIFANAGMSSGPAIALTCKRFWEVFYSAPEVWRHLCISAPNFEAEPFDGGILGWTLGKQRLLRRVGDLVQSAALDDSPGSGLAESLLPMLPEELTALELRFNNNIEGQPPPTLLASLPDLFPQLVQLNITARTLPPGLPAMLAQLRLSDLRLAVWAQLPDTLLSDLAPLAGTLTALVLQMEIGSLPKSLQQLTVLRQLRQLELAWDWFGALSTTALPLLTCFPSLSFYQFRQSNNEVDAPLLQIAGLRLRCASFQTEPTCFLDARLFAPAPTLEALLVALLPPTAARLQRLSLSRQSINMSRVQGLIQLASLQALCLVDCTGPDGGLTHLLQCMPGITALRLEHCGLSTLPAAAAGLSALVQLHCAHNALEYCPSRPYLSGLQSLDISSNRLARLPSALALASSLTRLSLARNPLQLSGAELQALLAALPALRALDLAGVQVGQAERQQLQAAASARGIEVHLS